MRLEMFDASDDDRTAAADRPALDVDLLAGHDVAVPADRGVALLAADDCTPPPGRGVTFFSFDGGATRPCSGCAIVALGHRAPIAGADLRGNRRQADHRCQRGHE